MTDEELIARLLDVYVDNTIRLTAALRIGELVRELAVNEELCLAFEEDVVQLWAKLTKAVAVLSAIGSAQTSGGGQASVMAFQAREALDEIKGETK